MILSKLDLQMYKIFDEYVDTELKFGCLFKYWDEWRNDELIFCAIYDDFWGTKTLSYLSPNRDMSHEITNFNYDMIWEEIDILWQIHLWTILQWLWAKNSVRMKYYIWLWTEKVYIVLKENDMIKFELNTTTPPLERTDEQKQEFIDFVSAQ